MKKATALGLAGLLFAASVASAQVNVVPQVGQINSIIRVPTYTATSIGLVPAASATDIFCLNASATKNISVTRVTIDGTAGTAVTTPFILYRRVSQDTGGTAATGLALPVAVPLNSTDPASTATLTAYTANPTIVDSSPSLVGANLVSVAVTTSVGLQETMRYGSSTDIFNRRIDLAKGSTQQLCVNLNAVSISSGVLMINLEWQEQP